MIARKVNTPEDIQQHYYKCATHLVAQSICALFIAMNEELGIGKERAARLLERYRRLNKQYNDYQDDAKGDAMLRTRMAEIGLQEFADAIMSMHDIRKYGHEAKQMNAVSIKEAQEAQEMLKVMKGLMHNEGSYSAKR